MSRSIESANSSRALRSASFITPAALLAFLPQLVRPTLCSVNRQHNHPQ